MLTIATQSKSRKLYRVVDSYVKAVIIIIIIITSELT